MAAACRASAPAEECARGKLGAESRCPSSHGDGETSGAHVTTARERADCRPDPTDPASFRRDGRRGESGVDPRCRFAREERAPEPDAARSRQGRAASVCGRRPDTPARGDERASSPIVGSLGRSAPIGEVDPAFSARRRRRSGRQPPRTRLSLPVARTRLRRAAARRRDAAPAGRLSNTRQQSPRLLRTELYGSGV